MPVSGGWSGREFYPTGEIQTSSILFLRPVLDADRPAGCWVTDPGHAFGPLPPPAFFMKIFISPLPLGAASSSDSPQDFPLRTLEPSAR